MYIISVYLFVLRGGGGGLLKGGWRVVFSENIQKNLFSLGLIFPQIIFLNK